MITFFLKVFVRFIINEKRIWYQEQHVFLQAVTHLLVYIYYLKASICIPITISLFNIFEIHKTSPTVSSILISILGHRWFGCFIFQILMNASWALVHMVHVITHKEATYALVLMVGQTGIAKLVTKLLSDYSTTRQTLICP